MIPSRLTALLLTALLCPAAFAATVTAAGTGPTDPVERPKAPAIQSAPGMNTDGSGVENALPPATGIDPRTQGNDPGRQGGTSGNPLPPADPDSGSGKKPGALPGSGSGNP
ncbi:hypothetical protein [Pseudomonas sp. NPDC089534]|uniref:hypothetical protein n=1 Tax=Pseudomonas sp. NPDC089534 TaxID=3364468 RepID=UPI0038055790